MGPRALHAERYRLWTGGRALVEMAFDFKSSGNCTGEKMQKFLFVSHQ